MEHLDGILKLTEKELAEVSSNGKFRSKDEVDSVYKLIDIAKDIYCIWEYEDEMSEDEYSGRYDGSRAYGYNSDSAYARGRRNARRDSIGRYSRDGRGSYRYPMSYRDGRSYADEKQEYADRLREMMDRAPDDQTRQNLQRMISQMEG